MVEFAKSQPVSSRGIAQFPLAHEYISEKAEDAWSGLVFGVTKCETDDQVPVYHAIKSIVSCIISTCILNTEKL